MTNPAVLARETATARVALEQASEFYDLSEEDIELVIDSETSLKEQIRPIVRTKIEARAHADAAKAVARQYNERARRLDALDDRCGSVIQGALESVGLKKLVLPEATVSIGRGRPAPVVTDETAIPLDYRHAAAPIEGAFFALRRAAELARSCGHADSAQDLELAAAQLLPMFLPDRKKIVAALEAGQTVPGCALSNGSSWLMLRTR